MNAVDNDEQEDDDDEEKEKNFSVFGAEFIYFCFVSTFCLHKKWTSIISQLKFLPSSWEFSIIFLGFVLGDFRLFPYHTQQNNIKCLSLAFLFSFLFFLPSDRQNSLCRQHRKKIITKWETERTEKNQTEKNYVLFIFPYFFLV